MALVFALGYDLPAVAHEWSLLAVSTQLHASRDSLSSAFNDPDLKFTYRLGLLSAMGSATENFGPGWTHESANEDSCPEDPSII